ncbi:hypothetical protein ACFLYF_03050 [Chloroflexota bacterium]
MRLGLLEIIIIIAIVIVIMVGTRVVRMGQKKTDDGETSGRMPFAKPPGKTRFYLRRVGGVFVVTGIIVLLAGISFFKWALQSYGWSFMLVVVGLTMLLLSRRR